MINYSEMVLEHFFHPRFCGELAANEMTGQATGGALENGAKVQMQLQLNKDTIVAIRFKAYGCVATIASCSWLCEFAMGKKIAEIPSNLSEMLLQTLPLPSSKLHCTIVIESVFQAAISKSLAKSGA